MGFNIVTVNVSQTIGAIPSNLQQMSAVLSFGSTTHEPGKPVLLTRNQDINDLVRNPIAALSAAAAGKSAANVTVTMTLPEGSNIRRENSSEVKIVVSGCSPDAWNGEYTATVTDEKTLTWTIADSQLSGSPVTLGQFSIVGSENLVTAVNTFFAQGNSVGIYLLELGVQKGGVSKEIAALKAYMEDPLLRFYAYLVPQPWDGDAEFISLAKLHTANEAMQYFFVLTKTPDDTNYVSPYAGIKSVIATADDTYPATNAAAAVMWNYVSASPSEINKVPPMAFRYLQAVNAHKGKNSILVTMTKQNINYVEGRFNFDYFNEVQEWQKNNPGKVWPGGLQGFSNQVNRSAYLSRGIRNNNPGNLNFAGQKGATLESGPNARFASFPTMLEGIAALDRQVMLYLKRGKNTIDQIIDIYAPSSDGNNTSSYKSYLSQYTGLGVKEKIDGSNFEIMRKLIQGIINHENGDAARAVSGDDVMRALAMNRGNVYSPNNTSQVIRLDVQQKPGSDILAQLAGMQQIPG